MAGCGLERFYNWRLYRVQQFWGRWAIEIHYLGGYCRFFFHPCISALNLPQIGPFEGSGDRKWLDMAVRSFIIGDSIVCNSFEEFELLKYIIWVVIVHYTFFVHFSAKFALNWTFCGFWSPKRLDMALRSFIIVDCIEYNSFEEFEPLKYNSNTNCDKTSG